MSNIFCKKDTILKLNLTGPMTIITHDKPIQPLELSPSGAKFDVEKPMMALVPPLALQQVAQAFTYGHKKYGHLNYMHGGISFTRLLSASLRHITSFIAGEDLDPESNIPHWACACANLMMMGEHVMRGNTKDDDRWKPNQNSSNG